MTPSAIAPGAGSDAWTEAELLAALTASAPRCDGRVERHETHASWVFVLAERAYKVKKPVALGFLDYSTLSRRRAACREEVRVNRALAPDVYRGVRALVRDGDGLRLTDDGAVDAVDAVEYVVEMRAFSERETFAGLIEAGDLRRADVADVARTLANFHRHAAIDREWGPERVLALWLHNLVELQRAEVPPRWRVDVALGFGRAFVHGRDSALRERASRGLARDGHGDLRCEHVLSRPVRIVDRIEFDAQLRRTDVAADLAFLAMDLEASDRRWAAEELYETYRRTGLDIGEPWLRDFYAAHWALVRAKVALIAASEHDGEQRATQLRIAERLWRLSERLCWHARRPLAIVVCGPAASGKSVLAAALSQSSGAPVVSSDAVRKRLAGLEPTRRAGEAQYTEASTHAAYAQLARDARLALDEGGQVIVDATCRARREREPLLRSLRSTGARALLVRCEVPLALALQRAERRLGEAGRVSDATPAIVERHYREFEEPAAGEADATLRLDTAAPREAQLAEVARAADHVLARA
ncbi:MAG TPA: AAA family ATPase [Solirubrobacteraceae bacterium]